MGERIKVHGVVLDKVVRGQDEHNGVVILFGDMHRAKSNAGRGILSNRLTENILFRKVRKLLPHKRFVIAVCSDVDILQVDKRRNALHRQLDHCLSVPSKGEKLLRHISAAFRPKALSPAARHDQRGFLHNVRFLSKLLCIKASASPPKRPMYISFPANGPFESGSAHIPCRRSR